MKADIHPKYHTDAKVTCACGNTFATGSTLSEIHVDICSKCHPFFTGEMRFVDTQGRVEKFEAQRKKAAKYISKKKKGKASATDSGSDQPQTLKEMLTQVKQDVSKPLKKVTSSPKPSKA